MMVKKQLSAEVEELFEKLCSDLVAGGLHVGLHPGLHPGLHAFHASTKTTRAT
jgi:hypothetical protein